MDFTMPIVRNAALRSALVVGVRAERLRPDTLPDAIAAPGETVCSRSRRRRTVYECRPAVTASWPGIPRADRALLLDGKTVGTALCRTDLVHIDSSAVVGKAVGNAPGATRTISPG
jgi:hypothetical protein